MSQVGRISGPLLQANLERNGVDLAFRNDLNTTQLLYLDVTNNKIGVNHPTPSRDLDVLGTAQTTNLISTTSLNTPGYEVTGSTFRTLLGDLNLSAGNAIVMANMETDQIRISDNIISTINTSSNIDITPGGSGTTEIFNDLNIYGNLDTTGNITFGGNITIGDNQGNDRVIFQTDIDTDIIPDQTNTFSLGSPERRWEGLYTYLINGEVATLDDLTVQGIDINFRAGGIFWVDPNGDDSNVGDNPMGAMRTIAAALARVDASTNQPFTVMVNSGTYEEIFPLVIPENVNVVGADIRNVIVTPTAATADKDAFHLNDKTVVSNLTIKDFTYNSTNNTGYAFRFAPNAVMNERSPYIQDVTVLTNPTTPGGSDAGRGAWIDGNELNSSSVTATMLFHSCTFISPGADVINMTNGVRVEWLNSFTYFANRGLYAFNGADGRTSIDGSTTIYGAELRSIGSANVYGTYGAVADGADCLMYLIQHNFAYIGAGADRTNDLDLVVQANEVVELNNGSIHYVSTDQVGNFRVGDSFFVNFDTGDTSLNIDTAEIDTLSGLTINSPAGTSMIDAEFIDVGNILITDNTISTNIGDLILKGSTGTLNLNDNTSISGNLDIVDNFSFGGTLNIAGDQPGRITDADRLVFNVQFEQDFNPHRTSTHSLGEVQRSWVETYIDKLSVGDIDIDGNVITTDVTSADLELRAAGTGNVVFDTSLEITNNFETSSTTSLQDLGITGTLTHVGAYNQTGDRSITGDLNVTGWLDVSQTVNLGNVLFDDNFITSTGVNQNLELRANSTGKIRVPYENVNIVNNLTTNDISNNNVNVTQQTQFNQAVINDITIEDNYIETNNGNVNLELRANSTGKVVSDSNTVIDNDLTVVTDTLLQDAVTGQTFGPELVVNGTYDSNLTGWSQTGGGFATVLNGNLRIDAIGAARNVSQEITVEAGKTYDFTAQFRFADNPGEFFYLRIFESGVGTLQE